MKDPQVVHMHGVMSQLRSPSSFSEDEQIQVQYSVSSNSLKLSI